MAACGWRSTPGGTVTTQWSPSLQIHQFWPSDGPELLPRGSSLAGGSGMEGCSWQGQPPAPSHRLHVLSKQGTRAVLLLREGSSPSCHASSSLKGTAHRCPRYHQALGGLTGVKEPSQGACPLFLGECRVRLIIGFSVLPPQQVDRIVSCCDFLHSV